MLRRYEVNNRCLGEEHDMIPRKYEVCMALETWQPSESSLKRGHEITSRSKEKSYFGPNELGFYVWTIFRGKGTALMVGKQGIQQEQERETPITQKTCRRN